MTEQEIRDADAEQLRIAVGIARGWTNIERANDNTSFLWGTAPEGGDCGCWGDVLLPKWSTNIDAAWELIDHMTYGWCYHIATVLDVQGIACVIWTANWVVATRGKTVPVAICRAYLLAILQAGQKGKAL